MQKTNLEKWIDSNKHLPSFLRSIDDKANLIEFFCFLYQNDKAKENLFNSHSLSNLRIYVFDIFFNLMAQDGLTLKKINKNVGIDFLDLENSLNEYKIYKENPSVYTFADENSYKTKGSIEKYRIEGKHLPPQLKEFDDVKDIFRYIHQLNNMSEKSKIAIEDISNRQGHIFIIDFVLWLLAKYGYCLSKCYSKQVYVGWNAAIL